MIVKGKDYKEMAILQWTSDVRIAPQRGRILDRNGKELDMGTSFDFFGVEASHNYPNLSEEVKQNRILLKTIMTSSGFNSFDSEWWHYNLKSGLNDKVSNIKWDCK